MVFARFPAVTRPAVIGDTIVMPSPTPPPGRELLVKRFRFAAVFLTFMMAMWFMGPAAAAETNAGALVLVQATAATSADEAAALVRAASGGRILSVRPDNKARPMVYHVKVLLDGGRVRIYLVDANSGQILP